MLEWNSFIHGLTCLGVFTGIHVYIYAMAHMWHQRTSYDNYLSLSVVAVLGIRLRWSGLGASASPSRATSAAPWV